MPTTDRLQLAILGPGLIGGSLCLDLVEKEGFTVSVWARRQEAVDQILAAVPRCRASTDLGRVVSGAKLIVLATPIEVMGAIAKQLVSLADIAGRVVVTDVGSVKESVVTEMNAVFEGTQFSFVGAHPMAGSEEGGFSAAKKGLFRGAPCVLTPVDGDAAGDVELAADFWIGLGACLHRMSPAEHDRRIALISHLPHLVAALTVEASLGVEPEAAGVAGSGFKDATRIAAGDPELWRGIFHQNRKEVVTALEEFHRGTSEVLAFLKEMDDEALHAFLVRASQLRRGVDEKLFSDPSCY